MKLERPLVFFDLETTGIQPREDRIVQIGAIKVWPDGRQEEKNVLLDPGIPIPPAASAVHGITDEQVRGKPFFRQIANSLADWLSGCDLAGYNCDQFDVPMLMEEFGRAGVVFELDPTRPPIDVLKVERNVNSHRLEATYRRYTGKHLSDAHDALADTRATMSILAKQLERHPDLPDTVSGLSELCRGSEGSRVDLAGKLYERNGQVYWSFGKHRGQLVVETASYAKWVLESDFPHETKQHIRRLLDMMPGGR
ncbi:MAG: putative polymerase epsilon chain [Bacteroidota bacterium]|jgi:DNA polymerase-3 subunit epsilon